MYLAKIKEPQAGMVLARTGEGGTYLTVELALIMLAACTHYPVSQSFFVVVTSVLGSSSSDAGRSWFVNYSMGPFVPLQWSVGGKHRALPGSGRFEGGSPGEAREVRVDDVRVFLHVIIIVIIIVIMIIIMMMMIITVVVIVVVVVEACGPYICPHAPPNQQHPPPTPSSDGSDRV